MQNKRLLSLDAFRGLTIAGMILVNTPGSWAYVYPPLLHAKWHGCTPTDLVFPFFLFIVGVSMSFSYSKFDYQWTGKSGIKILRRTLLIFFIGLLLNAFPFYTIHLDSLRIMGVLQRIALAFGFGGVIILLSRGKKILYLFATLILLFYWAVLWYFGDAGPYELESNFVREADLMILGESHMYKGFGLAFDPEGLLSSLPAVATVIIGFLVGRHLKENVKSLKKLLFLFGVGLLLTLIGSLWALVFPINKPLWTSSYVLYTGGLATMLLCLFYWLIDIKKWKKWSMFFVVFGINPLFAFVLSVIWVKIIIKVIRFTPEGGNSTNGYSWLYENIFVPLGGNMNGSLLFALSHIVLYWAILYFLYKRKIYIKI